MLHYDLDYFHFENEEVKQEVEGDVADPQHTKHEVVADVSIMACCDYKGSQHHKKAVESQFTFY